MVAPVWLSNQTASAHSSYEVKVTPKLVRLAGVHGVRYRPVI